MKLVTKSDVQYHEDDRAQRLFDVFETLPGQINISHVNSTEHIEPTRSKNRAGGVSRL